MANQVLVTAIFSVPQPQMMPETRLRAYSESTSNTVYMQ